MESLIINLIAGAAGGNGAAMLPKKFDLGVVGNSVAGIVGGGLGWQILSMVGGGGLDGIIGQVLGGGVGGGVLLAVVGLVRSALAK